MKINRCNNLLDVVQNYINRLMIEEQRNGQMNWNKGRSKKERDVGGGGGGGG